MKNQDAREALMKESGITFRPGEKPVKFDEPHVLHNPSKFITKDANGRLRVRTINDQPTKTQQQFKDQCDVNLIVAKYKTTGEWLHVARTEGVYADVSEISDYRESLHKVMQAQDAFMTIPSNIRLRFENDPGLLLEFLQNPANRQEAIDLGLIQKPSEPPSPETTTIQTTTKPKGGKSDHQPTKSEN